MQAISMVNSKSLKYECQSEVQQKVNPNYVKEDNLSLSQRLQDITYAKACSTNRDQDHRSIVQKNQGGLLVCLVKTPALRKTSTLKKIVLQRYSSNATLYKEVLNAFGLPHDSQISITSQGRILSQPDSKSLSEVANLTSDDSELMLELHLPALIGGMNNLVINGDFEADQELDYNLTDEQADVSPTKVQPITDKEDPAIKIEENIASPKQSRMRISIGKAMQNKVGNMVNYFTGEKKDKDVDTARAEEIQKLDDQIRVGSTKQVSFSKYQKLEELAQTPEQTENLSEILDTEEKESYEIWKLGFNPEINNFKAAWQDDQSKMNNAVAFSLPNDFVYYEFVEVVGVDCLILARFEMHKVVKTGRKFLVKAERTKVKRFGEIEANLEECKAIENDWHENLNLYRYSPKTGGTDITKVLPVQKVKQTVNYKDFYERTLFAGPDSQLFWVSGTDAEQLNIYSYNLDKHETFALSNESALHAYWTEQNINSKGYAMPQAWPIMLQFEDDKVNRVIIFSRAVSNERPSVCFYSVEQGHEFLQCFGASMLLQVSPLSDSQSTQYRCLFYACPLFDQVVDGEAHVMKWLQDMLEADQNNEQGEDPLVAKSQQIDIHGALASNKFVRIDLREQNKQQEALYQTDSQEENTSAFIKKNSIFQLSKITKKVKSQRIDHECTIVDLFKNFWQWTGAGPFTILMPQFDSTRDQFAMSNEGLVAICELKESNKTETVECVFKKVFRQSGTSFCSVRYAIGSQTFQILKHNIDGGLRMYQIDTENMARLDLSKYEIPADININRKHAEILLCRLFATDKKDLRNEEKLASSLKIVRNLGLKWIMQSYHPFVCMAKRGNPRLVYLAWQDNNKNQIISLDLTDVGYFYLFVHELQLSRKPCISILISDFDRSAVLDENQKEQVPTDLSYIQRFQLFVIFSKLASESNNNPNR